MLNPIIKANDTVMYRRPMYYSWVYSHCVHRQ